MYSSVGASAVMAATTAAAAAATAASPAAASPPVEALPPLLYQLRKGRAPPQQQLPPRRSPTPTAREKQTPAAASPAPPVRPRACSRSPATSPPSSSPRLPSGSQSASGTQYALSDVCSSALSEPACGRCGCCATLSAAVEGVTAAREEWRARHGDALEAKRRAEGELAALQKVVQRMRGEIMALQQAQSKHAPPQPRASAADLELARKASEQEAAIRALLERQRSDQQTIERLQLLLVQHSRTPAVSGAVAAPSLSLDGLSELQRHQLSVRADTEEALLRLQRLFPHQDILAGAKLTGNSVEAANVHSILLEQVEQNNPAVLGDHLSHLPHIISVFLATVETSMLKNAKLRQRVRGFFLHLKQMPPPQLQQLAQQLPPTLQHKLAEVLIATG